MIKLIIVLVLSLSTSFSYASNYFYIDNKDYSHLFYSKLGYSLDDLDDFVSKLSLIKEKEIKNNGDLLFYFKRLPRFSDIKVNGCNFFPDTVIKYAISSMGLKQGLENIKLRYKTNGFYNLKIKTELNKRKIIVTIDEGKQTKLCSLKFFGDKFDIGFRVNSYVSPGQILEKLSKLKKDFIKQKFFEVNITFNTKVERDCIFVETHLNKNAHYSLNIKTKILGKKEVRELVENLDDPLNYRILKNRISDMCEEKGLLCNTVVDKYYKANSEADLNITVLEKRLPYIKNINFKSENNIDMKFVKSLFKYNKNFFLESQFLNSLEDFKVKLVDNGYRVQSVTYTTTNELNRSLEIDIYINTKAPAKIISVKNICDKTSLVSLQDSYYSKEKLDGFCDELKKNEREKGYLASECSYRLRNLGDSVDLKVCFLRNTRFKVGDIFIWGNYKTKSSSIKKIIDFKKDDYINLEKLKKLSETLNLFPAFSSSSLEILDNSQLGKSYKDLIIYVNERAPRIINLALAYDTDTGLSFTTDYYHRNIFGSLFQWGLGGLLRTKFKDFRFFEYEFFTSIQRNNYILKTAFSDFDYNSYGKRSLKTSFTWQRDNSFNNHFYVQNILEFAKLHHLTTSVDTDNTIDLSIRPTYIYNKVDNTFAPSKGLKLYAYVDFNYSFSGVDSITTKGFINLRTYYPLYNEDYILVNYFSFGTVYAFKNKIPLDKRFSLGGATSLRGYDFNAIQDTSSDVTKQIFYLGTVEFRKKMFWHLWAIGFLDLGSLRSSQFSNQLLYSVGGGFRFNTLLGAITFVYGYVLDPQNRIPSSSYGQVHIALITF